MSFIIIFKFSSFILNKKKITSTKCTFWDQPSQIYFSKEFDPKKDEDIAKLFKRILEEIAAIESKVGYKPQVIVTDHADNLDLSPYKFEDYVRARWIDCKALI